MRTYKMFACLFLSALVLLNGFLLNASADEIPDEYGLSILSITSADTLGYIGFVNTGYDEWAPVLEYIKSILPDSNYIVTYSTSGGQFVQARYGNPIYSGTQITFDYVMTCSGGVNGYSCSAPTGPNVADKWLVENPVFAMDLPQPTSGFYSSFVNWNAVSFEQAESYYLNTDLSQASTQDVIDTINNQWAIDDGENFDTDSLVTELEGKLGVLGFASDTLIQFVGLFDSSNAGSTTLTFPAFSLNVQGQNYTIWDEVSFDLNSIYNDFSFLIDTVRTILTLFVWLAVFNYCVKSYERVVNR